MQYPIVVSPESPNRYVALPLGMPELKTIAATEADAIAQVSQALEKWLASAKVVLVDVPVANDSNPWLEAFGRSATDPDFAEFAEELEHLRDLDHSA